MSKADSVLWRAEDFAVPEPAEFVPRLRVDPDGRVSGHLYVWSHPFAQRVGHRPGSDDYSRFHAERYLQDGTAAMVGVIRARLDDPRPWAEPNEVAVVHCVDGELGPWICGRVAVPFPPGLLDGWQPSAGVYPFGEGHRLAEIFAFSERVGFPIPGRG